MERKGIYILIVGLLVVILLTNVVGTTFSIFGVANKTVKGEEIQILPKGTLIFNNPGAIKVGYVNAGDTLDTKKFTVSGKTDNSDNFPYVVNFNVENTYPDGVLYYTVNADNTSSNGTTFQSSSLPVAIPTGTSTIEIGSGTFAGPVRNAKHTYTITIYRAEGTEASGESSFSGELDVTQGS